MNSEILTILKNADGFCSGEQLSADIGMSRAAFWKNIQELRKVGYEIEAVTNVGYRLKTIPDKLFPHEIQHGLKAEFVGQDVRYSETIDSTMDEAYRLGSEGAESGLIVVSESQTKGRGRMGRSWMSPSGKGVYFSLLLRPKMPLSEVAKMTLLTAVAVNEAIREVCDVDVQIKWPNDLLIGRKKVAGFLTELNAEMDQVRFIVIGVGLNVNTSLSALPDVATSLKVETGKKVSRARVMQSILERIESRYVQAEREGFDGVFEKWKELSMTLGQTVNLKDGENVYSGRAVDLDSSGGLVIETKDGKRQTRWSGDVLV